uniref:Family with sequence similarity 83 member Hb n=1 Tax=Callorhinchus milii TaxID=7868 RepID=A0A4W3GHZ8_CALMI
MARRSQCSSLGEMLNDPNYVPPHYKEYYRLAIDVLAEQGIDSYYHFLADERQVEFLSTSEIEHINKHLRKPARALDEEPHSQSDYNESDSSGTYWPVHTDIDAPALDLGWPDIGRYREPSDVTIFVHPPAPDTLSIKEEARRLIRSANQVVAIVMDMFTDIDIFEELVQVANRGVPVYVLLDELHAHQFQDMVKKCQVNLSVIQFMRVRTVQGQTYFCRSGMSFHGNLMERFVLIDCLVVLSGSYSFMWSFEKIHRSMVHRFQGELVNIFDEEFRILFAQSSPLPGVESIMPKMESYYAVQPYEPRYRKRPTLSFLHHQEDQHSQNSGFSWGEVDPDRPLRSFRRDEAFRQTMEGVTNQGYTRAQFAQRFEQQKFQFDPTSRAILRSKKMEMDSYKRQSYAEGTYESYSTARELQLSRRGELFDEMDSRSERLEGDRMLPLERNWARDGLLSLEKKPFGQDLFDRIRSNHQGLRQHEDITDPYLEDFEMRSRLRQGSGDRRLMDDDQFAVDVPKRPSIGQTYACLKSPTQTSVLDQKLIFQESVLKKGDDHQTKQGLRSWRIGSYLSAYQDESQEGMEEGSHFSSVFQGFEDEAPPNPGKMRPSFERDFIYQSSSYLQNMRAWKTTRTADQSGSPEQGAEEQETTLMKQESMRSKINPLLQRGSRLRSSLIFNSSKIEQHSPRGKSGFSSVQEQIQGQETQEKSETSGPKPVDGGVKAIKPQTGEVSAGKIPSNRTQNNKPSETHQASNLVISSLEKVRNKEQLQLSKKVLDAIQKLDQEKPAVKEVKKAELGPTQKNGTIAPEKPSQDHRFPTETKPETKQSSAQEPVSKPNLNESLKCSLESIKSRSRASSTNIVEPATDTYGSTVSLDTGLNSELAKSKDQGVLDLSHRSSFRMKNFLNFSGEKKPKEEASNPSGSQPSPLVTGGEKTTATAAEVTSPSAEEKPQKSPTPAAGVKASQSFSGSRFASNVKYSSNLRDDTKVILEQISAHNQSRGEMHRALQPGHGEPANSLSPPVDHQPLSPSAKSPPEPTSSSPESQQETKGQVERDILIKRMDSIRKEKRVYSRFEGGCVGCGSRVGGHIPPCSLTGLEHIK